MTVFSTFFKVLKSQIGIIILYTILLLGFGGLNVKTNESNINYVADKPDIVIVNKDKSGKLSINLVEYLEKFTNVKDLDENNLDDALFYRQVNSIIYIPENYSSNIKNKQKVNIDINTTGDYESSLARMILNRYLSVQDAYVLLFDDEASIIENVNNTLDKEIKTEVLTKKDEVSSSRITNYYNFASYAIVAGILLVLGNILSSFNQKNIKKRSIVSSTSYIKQNKYLLFSSSIYAILLWIFYVLISIILFKSDILNEMFIFYIINSFIFTIVSLTLSVFLSNLVNNKAALSGLVNVIAVGSSFLCGVFVPARWLPKIVLTIAHVLPPYWYVNTNDILAKMEVINFENLKPVITNELVLIGFVILFVILNLVVTKKKQRID